MSEFPQPNAADAMMPESQPINTGDVNAGNVNIGPQSNSTVIETVNAFFDDDGLRASARRFAEADICDVSDAREEELKALYVGEGEFTDSLVAVLDRERVLFLTGERGVGKQTTALYVATRIADAHDLEHSTVLIAPLEALVHFELRNVAADAKFRRRVIVFDDALAKKNASLIDIFGRLERVGCDRLVDDLAHNDAYLIVTAASTDLAPFQQQLGSHLHVRELDAQLSRPLVEDGYARKVQWIAVQTSDKTAHVEQLTSKRLSIVNALKTLAAIASFIDFYIKRNDPDLESALDDYTDGGRWFRTSLAVDFDAWCCVLALVMAQATPLGEEVAWLDFERLRRVISDRLKADGELFPPWREKERARAIRTSGESLNDDALRNVAQIETISDQFGHTVRFIEPVRAADLWKTVFTHNRRILNAVIPPLRMLAEQERAIERLMLRVIAARAIGRIGEIDPDRMIRPLVRHWGGSQKHGHLVGRLLQGVLGSANEDYRETAWQHITTLVNAEGDNAAARLVSAIAAYAQAAAYDPRRAMARLGEIVVDRLAPAMEDFHQAARTAAIVDRTAADARSKSRAEALRKKRERLMRLAGDIEEKYRAALAATGKAVAYIAYDDPIGTLTAMRDWTSKGGQGTGIVVAILFLRVIADDLVPDEVVSSPLLRSLSTGGKEAVSELAPFLADVYTSIHRPFALPADTQRELQSEFTDCLAFWAHAGIDNHACRAAVEDLFVTLACVRGCLMREEIYTLVGSSVFVDDEDMCSFAIAVRKRLDN